MIIGIKSRNVAAANELKDDQPQGAQIGKFELEGILGFARLQISQQQRGVPQWHARLAAD